MDQNSRCEGYYKRRLSALSPAGLSRERAGLVTTVRRTTADGDQPLKCSQLAVGARSNSFGFIDAVRVVDGWIDVRPPARRTATWCWANSPID